MDNEDIIRSRDLLDCMQDVKNRVVSAEMLAERLRAEKEQNEADIKLCKQLEARDQAVAANMHRRGEKLNAIAAKNNTLFSDPCSDLQERELKQEHFRDEMRTRITAMAEAIDMLQEQLNRIERGLQHV